ncbi:Retrovirus-related Pol polyprotein from transposon RE1 [Vitis vinifera]|uniref:Retrovirus-related Pol polyprotein from transposon RE1 n=1 Tax=Vitis vinifera TaxID=29760 RepID=A0A438FWW8_VITVI|nr:Retrovirus-related Pol polyprotein from transposon RE1 [Vitis vinifera]
MSVANIGVLQEPFRKRKWCLRDFADTQEGCEIISHNMLSSQGCEVGFHLEVPSFPLAVYVGQLQKEIHPTVQKAAESLRNKRVISQHFAKCFLQLEVIGLKWLQLLQSAPKVAATTVIKNMLHGRFSLLFLLAIWIYSWQMTSKLCPRFLITLLSYDLHHFIDGAHTPPPPTVIVTGVASPNPTYTTWKHHDCLIFSALLGAISVSLQPHIARTTTSLDAWQTLANTYAKPSRGHIKQLKEQLKWCTKGSKSISEYMQVIKTHADELALLGKLVDDEDLIDRVLEGLSDEYKSIIDAINARDTSISFVDLHEKLLNKEASLQTTQPSHLSLLATTNPTAFRNHPNWLPPATTPQ